MCHLQHRPRPRRQTASLYRRLIGELARLFSTAPENVDLFGVQNNGAGGVDVRYAAHGSPYYRAEKMDGIVAQNKQRVRRAVARRRRAVARRRRGVVHRSAGKGNGWQVMTSGNVGR